MSHTPSVDNTHRIETAALNMPPRLLLGPGPSNAHPRVLEALGTPQVGHLDPSFIALMDEVQSLMRYAWQTNNEVTIPVSGTGSAAMEATFANAIEPGDRVLIAINGYFGHRMVDMATRYGADVQTIHRPWGEVFTLKEITDAIKQHQPAIFAVVHAETSTGARQPLEGVADICQANNCLLLIDTVTSLGGVPLFLDAWGVDMAYSGAQKCVSCPPGISPVTFSKRAMHKINNRRSKVANWYLDVTMVGAYWGSTRKYHHTAPINMNYGFREAMRLIAEEGLEARWERHRTNAEQLWAGLEAMGLTCHVAHEYRLPSLTTARIPDGIDGKAVAKKMLADFNIEIAAGLGELNGKVWRIGLMGYNSRPENVTRLLDALDKTLKTM